MSYSKKILIEIEKHLNSYTNQLFGCHLHLFYQILNTESNYIKEALRPLLIFFKNTVTVHLLSNIM